MISVIIPTYNEEERIEHAIASVRRLRDEADFEIIVGDGGSSDATVSVAQEHAQVVWSERGRGRQLNAAAERARGDIFFFLHAHATLPEGALTMINQAINANGNDGGGFSNVFSEHNRKIKRLGRVRSFRKHDLLWRQRDLRQTGGLRNPRRVQDHPYYGRLRLLKADAGTVQGGPDLRSQTRCFPQATRQGRIRRDARTMDFDQATLRDGRFSPFPRSLVSKRTINGLAG